VKLPWRLSRRSRRQPDIDGFLEDLSHAALGPRYTETDRWRDFHRVFDTAEGRRVLHQVLGWCHLLGSSYVVGDAYATHFHEGERNVGLRIFAALNEEPVKRPEAAETEEPEEE